MRALPIIIVVVLLAGIGYLLRNSVTGLFTGTTDKNDSQTVVLRQTALPTPTATLLATAMASPVSQATSIVNLNSTATPVPASSSLPTAGPADDVAAAAVLAAGLVGAYRLVVARPVTKAKIDIL